MLYDAWVPTAGPPDMSYGSGLMRIRLLVILGRVTLCIALIQGRITRRIGRTNPELLATRGDR